MVITCFLAPQLFMECYSFSVMVSQGEVSVKHNRPYENINTPSWLQKMGPSKNKYNHCFKLINYFEDGHILFNITAFVQ